MSKETADAHVTNEREYTWHLGEYQVLLAFTGDEQVEHFHWWWEKTGKHLWLKAYADSRGGSQP